MRSTSFHRTVAGYYDRDVELGFEARAGSNPILERIRNDFRRITERYPFRSALEIGCGPGFDVAWFAARYPDRQFVAVDISGQMARLASERIAKKDLTNAQALQSDETDLVERFGTGRFDLVYVYFGALNTVADLEYSAKQIHDLLSPGGHAVLTFVNKWYLREMIVQSLKLNFKTAFARLKNEWGGYSVDRHLPSRCYSPARIKKAFRDLALVERKGYSILFPAWYNAHKIKDNPSKFEKLWEQDHRLQNTCLWSKGEYTLFVFRR